MRYRWGLLAVCFLSLFPLPVGQETARASEDIESAGHALHLAMPAVAVGASAFQRDVQGLWQFSRSAVLTLGVTHALKLTVNAERPDGGSKSFPSGHTSISFCSAEFMRRRYGWTWGLPSYAAACFVAYSRVEAKRHHTKDVIAGALIGVAGSYLFSRPREGVSVQMVPHGMGCGLTVVCVW